MITSFIIHDLGHVLFSSADQHINPVHNWHAADYRHSISMRLPEYEPLIGRQFRGSLHLKNTCFRAGETRSGDGVDADTCEALRKRDFGQ